VEADPDALLRVLLNLVDNAAAASAGAQSPRIVLRVATRLGMGILELTDNGQGIAEEALPSVFAPLFTTKRDGSGLGLAIVQKLMLKMGGLATIRSTPGESTTVELRWPLTAVETVVPIERGG
jgi:signal transduction histidine kinase